MPRQSAPPAAQAEGELVYEPDGALSGLVRDSLAQSGQRSPDWARDLLARALQRVR